MSRIFDQLQQMEDERTRPAPAAAPAPAQRDPFQVVAVVSNKGGVGKTTVATNLAVYVRALREDLPVLLLSLDEQPMLERLFEVPGAPRGGPDLAAAFRSGQLGVAVCKGQFGLDYVKTSTETGRVKREVSDPSQLRRLLQRAGVRGLVIVDTKSDLEILTQNALAAADLTIVAVKDHASLVEARKVFAQLEQWGRPKWHARLLASLVDLRVKYDDDDAPDILQLLHAEIRRGGYPFFQTYVSQSPKVEGLMTNPERQARSVLHGARGTVVDRQLGALAREVLEELDRLRLAPPIVVPEPRPPAPQAARVAPPASAPVAARRESMLRRVLRRVPGTPGV